MVASIDPFVADPSRDYGRKVVAVEPGGAEFIPLDERHGSPRSLLWTWVSPNMEFATLGVGILGPLFFGLTFWQSVAAIVLGTALGSATHGVLSSWGPGHGLPQMIISRSAFGFFGNYVPATVNSLVAGIGWFAVNSVSGALALHTLFDRLSATVCLLLVVAAQLVIAFFGHNLIHAFERFAFPVLTVVFVIACVWALSKSHPNAGGHHAGIGGFLVMVGATFGYAAGWNPYGSDYTRYLAPTSSKRAVGMYAGLGVFLSCVLLEVTGSAVVTAGGTQVAPSSLTDLLPTWLGKLTLACICIGAVAANALNIYSGSISFLALGIRLPTHLARGLVAVVFGVIGYFVAHHGLSNAGEDYENFLLVISYWIGPWLGVVLTDRWLRRGTSVDEAIIGASRRGSPEQPGAFPMVVATVVSIYVFASQTDYTGLLPRNHPAFGDLTFEAGFLIAAALYWGMFRLGRSRPAELPQLETEPR
ncbi:purine-cytosine permease family protein [uncultured Jatrophihabitans sp.]|uniref:purine-cytosine permease family protein n=1 Tax=uncultured Jatrophihabitans sp. TaxID=1610747 RepID=UPI0035C96679